MADERILQELKKRFSAPLPEFYKRRIVFWHDEDREFEKMLENVQLDGVKLAVLTGKNTFAVKKLLCADDCLSDYLVYDPRSFDREEDNWLLNVQLYSEEFRADQISIWMDELELPSSPLLRSQVKRYRSFFQAKERRDAIKRLKSSITTAPQMHLAVMAALSGCADLIPGHILRSVLRSGLDTDQNLFYQSFVTYGADKPFWAMVEQGTGFRAGDKPSLTDLAVHVLLTAVTRTLLPEHLAGLEQRFSTPHQAWCYDFVSEWLHGADRESLYPIARRVEEEVLLARRLSKLTLEDLADTEVFPCINECILTTMMEEICSHIIQSDVIASTVEKRRTMAWYQEVSSYFEGLLQVAEMNTFYLRHSAGFHMVEPERIWKEYTSDYYQMDTCYRKFHLCFQRCLKKSHLLLDDPFKRVAEQVEGLYSHWFLGSLGESWSNAAAEELERFGKVMQIHHQEEFYSRNVASQTYRVFVIISDALRYEVAAELANQLRRETQSQVELKSEAAQFPTVTQYGMAALLPHKKLEVVERSNGELAILADGQSTDAGNRDKVLKAANPASVALKYKDIIGMKRADRAALVRGMEVVYLYHDKIDEASHTSDDAVFLACEDAITELKNLVRIITNEFGGTTILITADHGFLYTYSPLSEDDKVDKSTPGHQDVDIGRRYLITRSGAKPEYLLPVKYLGAEAGLEAWTPRESVRIKKRGGGLNFVHGGISLQEMVVPVIEYHFLRNQSKEYLENKQKYDTKPVEISLLSVSRKISNLIVSLNFYQKEAVGSNRSAASFSLYFVDRFGQKISDNQRIIADKTSSNAQDRTFRCCFNLRSQKYSNLDSYYLVIADESGLQAPIKEEFQIDIAFAVDEFDFFG